MDLSLLIAVRLHDGRYHGMSDGPPSPARLFQALVAGAGLSGPLAFEDSEALEWLQAQGPPVVACPVMVDGQSFKNYLPNNDLDAVRGDVRRIGEIRTWKSIRPRSFDANIPLLYVWEFDEGEESERQARWICAMAERLYQFGRGVDMAWASGEVIDTRALASRLSGYPGVIYHPSVGGAGGKTLACPAPGTLESLKARYAAGSRRFTIQGKGAKTRQTFSQPPKARFAQVAYESPPTRLVYDIRDRTASDSFNPYALAGISRLVVSLRDGAAKRLRNAMPDRMPQIERVLIGRKEDGADAGPTSLRVKIIPLPSIGHFHADQEIRRVLVEVPAGCPLTAGDVHWAFSGLDIVDPDTGEILESTLVPSGEEGMLANYGIADRSGARGWRTVTPLALPEQVSRRRTTLTPKSAAERAEKEARNSAAVIQALRHAGVQVGVESIKLQREPFEANGERADAFSQGTRFGKDRLWHAEIVFSVSVAGPLTVGDGRFLGLGLMAPAIRARGVYAFVIEDGLVTTARPGEVTCALRRASMARVQAVLGDGRNLPAFFTGHLADGSPALREQDPHLVFAFDPRSARLLILAPHVVQHREPTREETQHLTTLEAAIDRFRDLRAGPAGHLRLRQAHVDTGNDPLFAPSRVWETVIPYQVTRHTKRGGAEGALMDDLRTECRRHGLPEPFISAYDLTGMPGIGLIGKARMTFKNAVQGPIILGRTRHLGGGLFLGMDRACQE